MHPLMDPTAGPPSLLELYSFLSYLAHHFVILLQDDNSPFNNSEDCLTLNVIRPRGLSDNTPVPVLVWSTFMFYDFPPM